MLLAPFVPVRPPLRRWFPAAFALFAVYTGAQATRLTRVVEPIRSARAADAIPRGAVVFPVPLRARMGAVEVSYARHLLADVALRRDLVMPDVFCSHPAHPLACEPALPVRRSEIPVGRFESLDPAAKSTALSDPDSFIARAFHATAHEAAGADFLLVLGSDELRPLFEREVVRPLSAVRVAEGGPLLVYRLPRAVAQR